MNAINTALLLQFIVFLIISHVNSGAASLLKSGTKKLKPNVVNEMLIPRHSTTALMCEPIFTGTGSQAQWYHGGALVANVSSTSNAVLHNLTYNAEQTVPEVGFLIITNISLDDEGDYWCRRTDNRQVGEVARIVVAYVEQFAASSRPVFHPAMPSLGQHVTAHCPTTKAVPPPTYTWFLNGEPVDLSTKRIIQSANGSLHIRQFLRQDIGVYECVVTNFAGRTSARIFVDAAAHATNDVFDGTIFASACRSALRSGVLWFLIGCLVTSTAVLSYLVCAVLLVRPNHQNRTSLYPGLILRAHPNLAPGFRKVVAPIVDVRRSRRISVPEQATI